MCIGTIHYILLIYTIVNHRILNSFPTRRSSDLGRVVPIEGDPIDGGTVLLRDGKIAAVEGPGYAAPDGAEVVDAVGKWVDRKSTRLNSSHTVISYAVFCLKKKKKDKINKNIGCS